MASVNPKEGCCLLGGRVCLHDFCLGGWVFCFIYSALASASPCVEENKETNSGGGEESQTEPSPSGAGWERPGRSRGRCRGPRRGAGSRAPRPLRADPARILHVSFLFFLPFFFLPLLFFPLFPPLFPPSLPSVVGSVFWYFLPPPPPPSSCPAAARRSALSVLREERLRGAHACPRHPIPRVSWQRRCRRRGGGGRARRAEGGAARGARPPRPGKTRRAPPFSSSGVGCLRALHP